MVKKKKKIFCLYILLLHAFLLYILVGMNVGKYLLVASGVVQRDEITQHYKRMVAHQKRIDAHVPENSILFFGDSIVQGLCTHAISNDIINFGIGTDTTKGLLDRIGEYESLKTAKSIFFYIGGNDFPYRNNKEIVKNYNMIISTLPKNIPVFLCGIINVDEDSCKNKYNNRIVLLNKEIKRMCSENESIFYIGFEEAFIDKSHNLKSELHIGDGKHLNKSGYSIMIKYVSSSLKNNTPKQN